MQDMLTGKVFYYNGKFGYLSVDGSVERVFFHHSEFPDGHPPICGEPVSFTLGKYSGKICAIDVRPTSLSGTVKGGA